MRAWMLVHGQTTHALSRQICVGRWAAHTVRRMRPCPGACHITSCGTCMPCWVCAACAKEKDSSAAGNVTRMLVRRLRVLCQGGRVMRRRPFGVNRCAIAALIRVRFQYIYSHVPAPAVRTCARWKHMAATAWELLLRAAEDERLVVGIPEGAAGVLGVVPTPASAQVVSLAVALAEREGAPTWGSENTQGSALHRGPSPHCGS